MSELAVQYIRTNVKKGFLDYSQHALERMLEREIADIQVVDCILRGKIIEIQNFIGQDIKILFQEATAKAPELYVVVAASFPNPVVATVCKFEKEVWEYINGVMKRRQDNG